MPGKIAFRPVTGADLTAGAGAAGFVTAVATREFCENPTITSVKVRNDEEIRVENLFTTCLLLSKLPAEGVKLRK